MSSIEAPPDWQTDPARMRRIAVACGRMVWLWQHRAPRGHEVDGGEPFDPAPGAGLADLVALALTAQCGALWLLPQPGAETPAVADFDVQARALLDAPHAGGTDLLVHALSAARGRVLAGLVIQRRGSDGAGYGPLLMVYHAGRQGGWPGADRLPAGHPAVRAALWSAAVRLAAYQLGAQLRFSPTYTGRALLRQSLAAKRYALPLLSPALYELVCEHLPTPMQWSRPHTFTPEQLLDGVTIFKYDRNASYLASAGAEMPTGDPDPAPPGRFMPGTPGFYHVRARPPADWPREMPGPFAVPLGMGADPPHWPGRPVECWAWEPIIRAALRHGWVVDCIEGWYWPRSARHQCYRDWSTSIWEARTRCTTYGGVPGEIAAAICKQAGVATVGGIKQRQGRALMAASQARAEGREIVAHAIDDAGNLTGDVTVSTPLGRWDIDWPHHWATIIANATERLLEALWGAWGYHPAAAYVDAVYCAAPWPTGALDPDRLGKWKLEGETPLTAGELDAMGRLGAQGWVKRLAAIRRAAGTLVVAEGEEG